MKYNIKTSFIFLSAVYASKGPSPPETKLSPAMSGVLIATSALAGTLAVLSATTTVRKNQKLRSRLQTAEDTHEQTTNQSKNDLSKLNSAIDESEDTLEASQTETQVADSEAALAEKGNELDLSSEKIRESNKKIAAMKWKIKCKQRKNRRVYFNNWGNLIGDNWQPAHHTFIQKNPNPTVFLRW